MALSDAAGGEVGRVQYDPYGEVLTSTLPADLTDRLFTSQRFDSSTGLYYYNARYYDPHLGRFIQPDTLVPDPLNPQAWNRFSYCYNNPTSYVDPSGHIAFWDVLDFASFAWSSFELYHEPSWANLGWWALDAISLLPLIPSVGLLRHGDEAVDLLRAAGRMEDAGDARVGLIAIERVAGSTKTYQRYGHVAVFVEIGEQRWVRGFWPIQPPGMTDEVFEASLWTRTFPGRVRDDAAMFAYAERIVRSWDVPEQTARGVLGVVEEVGPRSLEYGLRPGKVGGYNCVTWAGMVLEESASIALRHPSGYSAWRGALKGGIYTTESAGRLSWLIEAMRAMPGP